MASSAILIPAPPNLAPSSLLQAFFMPIPAPKYFKTWIIFFVIATVGAGILGLILGAFLGAYLKVVAHAELNTIKLVAQVAGFIAALPVSYFTFRWAVEEFIVKDLTTPPAEPPQLAK